MGSLQDQLLKAGLVDEQKLKQNRSEKRKKRRSPKKGKQDESDLARAYAERARLDQQERDRELNRKRELERQRRERNARLKQLIEPNKQNDPKGEVPRFFEHNGKIRKLYVNQAQQQGLNDAQLGIAYLRGRYFVLAMDVLERVAEVSPEAVAFDSRTAGDAEEAVDDAYQDERFQVPDDLQW